MFTKVRAGESQIAHWLADDEPLLEIGVGELLRRVAAEVPDRCALIDASAPADGRRRWTYAELLVDVERVARSLRSHFSEGERVALWAANSPEWIITQLGAALAGVVLVTIDPAYRSKELSYVLRQSEAAGVLHDDTGRGYSRADLLDDLRGELPHLRSVFDIFGDELRRPPTHPVVLPTVDPRSTLQIQYTSGTTGFPKGAELHHLGAINTSLFCARRGGFEDGGVWVNMLPLSHIAGCITSVLGPITHRGAIAILNKFDAAEVLDVITEERGTMTLAVPTMLISMLEDPNILTRDLSSLRSVISGAATVPVDLVERVKGTFGCGFSIVYGLTEGPIVLQTHITDSPVDQAETIGQPQANVELAIVDPASLAFAACDEPGEIWIRAYSIMNGYYRNAEATRETVDGEGWLRSGDLATMDDRGFVRITGRLKDMIIRGGENLYPREIEELIFTHPSVADVSVIGIPDDKLGEVVAAVVRTRDGQSFAIQDLHEFCSEHLAYSKVPALWGAVESFPLTPSGKVQKHVLRSLVVDGEIVVTASRARPRARPATDSGT